MTTTDLLALLAPHRDALKELGWTYWDQCDEIGLRHDSYVTRLHHPDHAAMLIESIVRRELDRWAKAEERTISIDPSGDYFIAAVRHRSHWWAVYETHNQHSEFAALLSLWAWCREVKG